MDEEKVWSAILLFGIAAALFDTHYVMPNFHHSTGGSWLWQMAFAYLRFLFGLPLIAYGLVFGDFVFGERALNSAAASALVMYTLLVPYLFALLFFIEGRSGVPPAYRFFQFFITRSGARRLDRGDYSGFNRAVSGTRHDRHQAKMEAEELRAAAKRADVKAARINKRVGKQMRSELERVEAAERAAKAAAEKFRAEARERAFNEHKRK